MMSMYQINEMSREAAVEAAKRKKKPFVPFDEAEVRGKRYELPFLGDYVPKGWEKVDDWFVDSSGFGSPDEPAMMQNIMFDKMAANCNEEDTFGYAIVSAGQFQANVGVYKKVSKKGKAQRFLRDHVIVKVIK